MKKIFLSLMIMFIAVLSMNKVIAQVVPIETGAKIEFVKETHDYGTIKYGADGACTFEFKNTGDAPLIISNSKGSCGCTVPEWPKEEIGAGKTGVIKVSYDSKRSGAINKNVTLTIQNKEKDKTGSKMLYIKGNVEPPPADAGMPEKKNGMAPLEK
jgi:hypothetical protein